MEVLVSIFDRSSRCSSCLSKLKLLKKRRKCAECSTFYIDQLFCSECSIKIPSENTALFSHRRYCLTCYTEIQGGSITNGAASMPASIASSTVPSSNLDPELGDGPMKFLQDRVSMPSTTQDPLLYYRIHRKLGKGGSGLVFKAENIDTNALVALKKVLPEDSEELNLIRNEIALTMASDHPNILKYFETFEFNDEVWMVVELLEGSLYELISQHLRKIPEAQIAFICREILRGLQFIHHQHRIHRDMKSDNVLIDAHGDIKLGDFGFAAQLTQERQQRHTIIGTPSWMAPEVIQGRSYNDRVDIWSFGIIALELADGEPPYLHDEPMQALHKIVTLPAPTLKNPDQWSSEFNDFVTQALRKAPRLRPSATELLEHPFIVKHVNATSRDAYVKFLHSWKPKST